MSRSGDRAVRLATTAGSVEAGVVITCAGLHSDRLARMTGGPVSPRIVPFRVGVMPSRPRHPGSYAGSSTRCPSRPSRSSKSHERRLVLAREGYGGWDVNLRDLWETLSYIGLRVPHPRASVLADGAQRGAGRPFEAENYRVRDLAEIVRETFADCGISTRRERARSAAPPCRLSQLTETLPDAPRSGRLGTALECCSMRSGPRGSLPPDSTSIHGFRA